MRADLNPGIDDETRRAIEALSTEYSWLVDHGYADQAADLFTDDAVLSAGEVRSAGSQAFAAIWRSGRKIATSGLAMS